MRKKFLQYEARRKLEGSYELFLCDSSLIVPVTNFLGKLFLKKKKQPLPIKIPKKEFTKKLERRILEARNSTCFIKSEGLVRMVKVGVHSFSPQQIVDNVLTAMSQIAGKVGGWKNVQCVGIRAGDTPLLPFYVVLPLTALSIPVEREGGDGEEEVQEEVQGEEVASEEAEQVNVDLEDNMDEKEESEEGEQVVEVKESPLKKSEKSNNSEKKRKPNRLSAILSKKLSKKK